MSWNTCIRGPSYRMVRYSVVIIANLIMLISLLGPLQSDTNGGADLSWTFHHVASAGSGMLGSDLTLITLFARTL